VEEQSVEPQIAVSAHGVAASFGSPALTTFRATTSASAHNASSRPAH
jgi:hypothetical protein